MPPMSSASAPLMNPWNCTRACRSSRRPDRRPPSSCSSRARPRRAAARPGRSGAARRACAAGSACRDLRLSRQLRPFLGSVLLVGGAARSAPAAPARGWGGGRNDTERGRALFRRRRRRGRARHLAQAGEIAQQLGVARAACTERAVAVGGRHHAHRLRAQVGDLAEELDRRLGVAVLELAGRRAGRAERPDLTVGALVGARDRLAPRLPDALPPFTEAPLTQIERIALGQDADGQLPLGIDREGVDAAGAADRGRPGCGAGGPEPLAREARPLGCA